MTLISKLQWQKFYSISNQYYHQVKRGKTINLSITCMANFASITADVNLYMSAQCYNL